MTEFEQWQAAQGPVDREKLTAGITSDAVELPDEDLAILRKIAAEMKEAAYRKGTARRIDGPGLAEAQRQREGV